MGKRLAIYPGSFNPLHVGHLGVYLEAKKIFDEVIIAVGVNPCKAIDVNKTINRVETIKLQMPGHQVESYSGFLADYVRKKEEEGFDVTVIRGLRNGADLDYEVNQLRVIQDQHPSIKMIFIPCSARYEHVSSSMIRAMEEIQLGAASEYIVKPEMVERGKAIGDYYSLLDHKEERNFELIVPIELEGALKRHNRKFKIKKTDTNVSSISIKYNDNFEDNESFSRYLYDWLDKYEERKNKKDYWVEHPLVPGYRFKNLRLKENNVHVGPEDIKGLISITLQYDEFD